MKIMKYTVKTIADYDGENLFFVPCLIFLRTFQVIYAETQDSHLPGLQGITEYNPRHSLWQYFQNRLIKFHLMMGKMKSRIILSLVLPRDSHFCGNGGNKGESSHRALS